MHITLKYGADKNEKVISGLKRISKPGLRVYAGTARICQKYSADSEQLSFLQTKVLSQIKKPENWRWWRSTLLRLVGLKALSEDES